MINILKVENSEQRYVQLFNGQIITLEELVMNYERQSKQKEHKLKVGEWFFIDREIILKNEENIQRKCQEAGSDGEMLWIRFKESNRIATENYQQYPQLIQTYIFEHNWEEKTEQEMRDMCESFADGMCDEIIFDLELQMRICNGESLNDLMEEDDRLPYARMIKCRNGENGYVGGGVRINRCCPPVYLRRYEHYPNCIDRSNTPYAFRRMSFLN